MEAFNETEANKMISLERARELLGPDCHLTDEELTAVLWSIKQFCVAACKIYFKELQQDRFPDQDELKIAA